MSVETPNPEKVAAKTGAAQTLRTLFIDSLKDIYWAENALIKTLPKIRENAQSEKLANSIDEHLGETNTHKTRLEEAFDMLGEPAEGKKCEAMDGILKEGEEIMEETEPGSVRDAGIIAASQKVEHYEIATYGAIISWAKKLGAKDVADLLHQTLEEEKNADQTLADLAESEINEEADKV